MNSGFFTQSIGQLGFVVENLEKTIEAYSTQWQTYNWQLYTYGPQNLQFMHYHGHPTSYTIKVGLGYIGNTRIELIQNLEGKTVYTDHIEYHGYGLHHLGIYVQDKDAALNEIQSQGFHVIMDGGGQGLDGDGYFGYLNTEATLGVIYEIIQRPKRRPEPEKVFTSC